MKEEIYNYINNFGEQTRERFKILFELIYQDSTLDISEKLWAKLPSFSVGNNVVRLIPFNDHINVNAKSVIVHKDELSGYKITPKGMLQIFHNQEIPINQLRIIFDESLKGLG